MHLSVISGGCLSHSMQLPQEPQRDLYYFFFKHTQYTSSWSVNTPKCGKLVYWPVNYFPCTKRQQTWCSLDFLNSQIWQQNQKYHQSTDCESKNNLNNAVLTKIQSRQIEFNSCLHSDCKGIFISLFQYLLENIFSLSRCINSLLFFFYHPLQHTSLSLLWMYWATPKHHDSFGFECHNMMSFINKREFPAFVRGVNNSEVLLGVILAPVKLSEWFWDAWYANTGVGL